jgi:hypothetical protein
VRVLVDDDARNEDAENLGEENDFLQ